jgi:hypothetical protein
MLNEIKTSLKSQSKKFKKNIFEIHSLPGLAKTMNSTTFKTDLEKLQSIFFSSK